MQISEIFIREYLTNEKQKIDVAVKEEILTIKYPDNYKDLLWKYFVIEKECCVIF